MLWTFTIFQKYVAGLKHMKAVLKLPILNLFMVLRKLAQAVKSLELLKSILAKVV